MINKMLKTAKTNNSAIASNEPLALITNLGFHSPRTSQSVEQTSNQNIDLNDSAVADSLAASAISGGGGGGGVALIALHQDLILANI